MRVNAKPFPKLRGGSSVMDVVDGKGSPEAILQEEREVWIAPECRPE